MNRVGGPIVLLILDGWGIAPPNPGNAISIAGTPQLDKLRDKYPSTTLKASGEAAGLMSGQMGDSNVGHLNLGAGRVVHQDVVRINRAIERREFQENAAFHEAFREAREKGSALHLMGLVSDGGVHSHEDHLHELLKMAKDAGVKTIWVHAFLDGRDVPPRSALPFLAKLEDVMGRLGLGAVATVSGRHYAMDRDGRWQRTQRAFSAIVEGEGRQAESAQAAIQRAYQEGDDDEFVKPTVVGEYEGVLPEDPAIFFNFRPDRARQLVKALVLPEFEHFPRPETAIPMRVTGMTIYQEDLPIPHAFDRQRLQGTFGEVISRAGLRQLRVAETEKYAHVTFFFSGMQEDVFPGESRMLIPSLKVATYDKKPEMSAAEVTAALVEELKRGHFDVFIANLANLDMVGHTGCLASAQKAVNVVDACAARIARTALKQKGHLLIVGDHGNAEQMVGDGEEPHTAHTENDVPCILVSQVHRGQTLRSGALGDVAPTLLEIMGIDKPAAMTGHSLLAGEDKERV